MSVGQGQNVLATSRKGGNSMGTTASGNKVFAESPLLTLLSTRIRRRAIRTPLAAEWWCRQAA